MKSNLGQAVRKAKVSASTPAGFEVLDLGPFDNNRNDVLAINDVGQCTGVSASPESGRIEAFIQEKGSRKMLGTLGGSFSIARGINNQGDVVGGVSCGGGEDFSCLLYRGNVFL